MANNDLAIRFTEENYATRSEVAKDLNMGIIDGIWSNILSYRANFNRYLSLKAINRNSFKFCYCASVSSKIENADMSLMKVMKEILKIDSTNGDLKTFTNRSLIACLKEVAKLHSLDVTDEYLRAIINNEILIDPSYSILKDYASGLKFIETLGSEDIDVDYLAQIYSIMTATPELVSFYRTKEDTSRENKVLIDRVYTSAPTALIERMMDELFEFIHSSPLPTIVKAIIVIYYFELVKPFPAHNEEIAILLMKAVIGKGSVPSSAILLNFEKILNINKDIINKVNEEVQKTDDITYFVNYIIPFVIDIEQNLLDSIASFKSDVVKKDFYKVDEVKPVIKEEVKLEAKEKIKPVEKQIEKEEVTQERVAFTPSVEQIAISYIPPALDEKEASRLEEHLLELDPSMRRGEAAFYARHCTLGKKYTIAQCKKFLSSAYETARKTMERLVELGYYRKEMVRNKSVYTPIPRK